MSGVPPEVIRLVPCGAARSEAIGPLRLWARAVTARERRRVPCVASNTVNKGLAPRRADMHAAGKYRIDVLRKGSDPQPVIRSFADAETERIWHQQRSRRLPAEIQQRALNKLAMLSHATDLNDLRVPPGNRLEALSGDRAGQHSVRINQQWRICFRWTNGDAHEVEIVDYH